MSTREPRTTEQKWKDFPKDAVLNFVNPFMILAGGTAGWAVVMYLLGMSG